MDAATRARSIELLENKRKEDKKGREVDLEELIIDSKGKREKRGKFFFQSTDQFRLMLEGEFR